MIVMTGWGVITTLLLLGKDKELASVCIKPTSPWANWCTSDLIWITKYIWVPHSGLVVWLHLLVTLSVDFWISKRISSELSSMTFLGGVVIDCGRGSLVGLAIGRQCAPDGSPAQRAQMAPRHPGTSAIWSTLGAGCFNLEQLWCRCCSASNDAAAAAFCSSWAPGDSSSLGQYHSLTELFVPGPDLNGPSSPAAALVACPIW